MGEVTATTAALRRSRLAMRGWPLGHLVPLLALLAFNLADVATTHHIIGMGGREMNPVAGWLLANGFLLVAKLALVGVIATLLAMAPRRLWVTRALWALTAFYGSIIAWHVIELTVF
jgi:hypothetical protein